MTAVNNSGMNFIKALPVTVNTDHAVKITGGYRTEEDMSHKLEGFIFSLYVCSATKEGQ